MCVGGEEHSKYKQQVVEMLKAGQLVVQMLAAEETISMPDGSRKATFTQETWDMVRSALASFMVARSCQRLFPDASPVQSCGKPCLQSLLPQNNARVAALSWTAASLDCMHCCGAVCVTNVMLITMSCINKHEVAMQISLWLYQYTRRHDFTVLSNAIARLRVLRSKKGGGPGLGGPCRAECEETTQGSRGRKRGLGDARRKQLCLSMASVAIQFAHRP